MDKEQTKVVFRVFKEGDVIALFPYEDEGNNRCTSYQHVGQHSAADYWGVLDITRPATQEEYEPLYKELTSFGYNLKVIKRYSP